MYLVLSVLAVGTVLLVSEYWWRHTDGHSEFSRKFVHITIGSFVASWPFYLSWSQIEVLSILLLIGVSVSKMFGILGAIHSVQRPTFGELYFAVAVGAVALISHNKWVYAAALLHMSLADGLAAVIGVKYGNKSVYHIMGHVKSVAGSATFFVISLALLIGFGALNGTGFEVWFIAIAVGATALENIGITGLDNLLVPLSVTLALKAII